MVSFAVLCDKCSDLCSRLLQCICPLVYNVLYSKKNDYKVLKTVLCFFYGLLLGIAFFELILVDLDFAPDICYMLGGVICLMLAVGNAVSVQIRCISLLTFPSFCGRAGRGVLKAVVLAYIIAGPIQSLAANGREVVRVFACTTSLTYNLTRTRFDLMFRPFQQGLLKMKGDISEVKDTVRSVRDVVVPVVEEVEGEEEMKRMKEDNDYLDKLQGDSKRSDELNKKFKVEPSDSPSQKYEKGYRRKLESRCQDMMSKGAKKCRSMFSNAYDRCYDKVSWAFAWLLCWPMKLTFVCNLIEAIGGESTCDSTKSVDTGFGEGYTYLKEARGNLAKGFKDAKLQYAVGTMPPLLDVRGASDTARAVLHDFQTKKRIADFLMLMIKRLLAFVFIKIIFGAQEYHDKYLRDINFDNVYITRYFRRIDGRRHTREQHTLLPLKKVEKIVFVDPYSPLPSKRERLNLCTQTVKLLLEMITPVAFVLLDLLLFQTLDLVRRHAHIEYTQTGSHDLSLKVRGSGMIAKLVRSVISGFNIKKKVKTVRSNKECLPRPHNTVSYYYIKIFGTYLLIWLMLIAQGYIMRLQRVICAYFYPKHEKRRVLFLYNETLQRRIGSVRVLGANVRRMAREHKIELETTMVLVLRLKYPRCCAWLRLFSSARGKCLVCSEPEPFSRSTRERYFHECENPDCHFIFCKVCWTEVGEICYACSPVEGSDFEEEDEDVL